MMESMLFSMALGAVIGFLWGRYTTKRAFELVFKQFSDEVYRQYLMILEHHNVKIKPEVRKKLWG